MIRKKPARRLCAMLLCMVMLLTMLPIAALAAEDAMGKNLALDAQATANRSHSAPYVASKVNDGNTNTNSDNRWTSGQTPSEANPQWVQLEWTAPQRISTVVIREWSQAAARVQKFTLSISNDGTAWETIHTGTGIGRACTVELDHVVETKFLRLTIQQGSSDVCITELEAYFSAGDATIKSFQFMGNAGVIDHDAGTISFQVDEGVGLTGLTPQITVMPGASVHPQGPQNFTSPVTYTVTAKDDVTTKQYVVTAHTKGYLTDADLTDTGAADVAPFGAVPTPYQYQYHRDELAAFLHFGMNTFTGSEWGNGKENPSQFTLTEKVDADNYVKTLKDAGFTKLIVTAKHHDGFCIWDSQLTEHDTGSTGYPGGDVLEDISAACTRYDMDMGLYLSPWDVNSEYYGYRDENGRPTSPENDKLDYNDYYDGQLREVLGNDKYGNGGKFVEVWMDGAKGSGSFAQEYDFDRYLATIRELEGTAAGRIDDPLLFGCGIHTNTRWIGNEAGVANEETWAKVNRTYDAAGKPTGMGSGPSVTYKGVETSVGVKNGNFWSVPEVDARITSGWFWGSNKCTPKTLEQLRDMYVHSVGHTAPLLLNVPLNNRGTLDEPIRQRVEEWGENVRKSFHENNLLEQPGVTISASEVQNNDIRFKPSNVADGDDSTYWTATQGTKNSTLMVKFDKKVTFDAMTLEEEIKHGQRVEAFSVYYKSDSGDWLEFASGTTIGGKRVILEHPVTTDQIKIQFQGMTENGVNATPVISHVGVYKTTKDFQLGSAAPDGMSDLDSATSAFQGTGWTTVTDRNATGGSYLQGGANNELTISFAGTKAWLIGFDGTAELRITVDDGEPQVVSCTKGVCFETADLEDGPHTMKVEVVSGQAKIDALYTLNNGGKGLLEFEHASYTVDEDMWFEVKVVRKGGSTGMLSALVQDNPGSAVQSSYVPTEGVRVDFADGETEKTVRVRTKRYTETTGTLSFTLELVPVSQQDSLTLGFQVPATVNITDAESYENGYLQGIQIKQNPTKTAYHCGETLDTAGLIVEGLYPGAPNMIPVASGNGLGNRKEITLGTPVTASRLRLTMNSVKANQTDAPCLSEIEVYNGSDGTNLARAATATAISEHGHPNGYKANRLNDGTHGGDNRWSASNCVVANGALPTWVQLNWNEEVTFDRIVIYEWENVPRADAWQLDAVAETHTARELDESQYTVTAPNPLVMGTNTITVKARENEDMTASFEVTMAHQLNKVEGKAPSCTEAGTKEYWTCDCGLAFEDEAGTKAIDDVDTWKVLPALEHQWEAPTYQWGEDNKTCTAARTCTSDASNPHVETETVAAAFEDTKAPTVDAEGERTFTADFKADWAATQTKKVALPKLDPEKPNPKPDPAPDIPPYIPHEPAAPVKPTKPVAKPELPFTDVSKNDWFFDSVYSAWENDLLNGMTATEFAPNSTLTVAQTIKLAAATHQKDKLGKVTLTNGAEQWYSTYVSYAIANGVIEKAYADYTPAQMNAPVSRREFVKILHGAKEFYAEKNTVADNAIPDVKMADKNAAEIYAFYRAGILTGSDEKGTFYPETNIKRSEAATILVRMFEVAERQSITLG